MKIPCRNMQCYNSVTITVFAKRAQKGEISNFLLFYLILHPFFFGQDDDLNNLLMGHKKYSYFI